METMTTVHGCEQLVRALDQAVSAGGAVAEVTERVQHDLSRLILAGEIELPDELRRPVEGHYARRLVHRSPDRGYVVVAMIWGPDQGTPLHDHAGTWCVEGVFEGEIEVTRFDLVETSGDRCRFERHETVTTGVGCAGSLIPPYEYHSLANGRSETSVTLHVYGGEMTACTAFEPLEEAGWYNRRQRQLSYDA